MAAADVPASAAAPFKIKLRVGTTALRVPEHEESRMQRPRRARREVDYRQLEQLGAELQPGIDFRDMLTSKAVRLVEPGPDVVRRISGATVTAAWLEADGFTTPLLVEDSTTVAGLRMPGPEFGVNTVLADVGGKRELDIIEVATQSELVPKWTLAEWAEYFAKAPGDRARILNVISLEVSNTPLRSRISSPAAVRAIDWIETVWPREAEGGAVPAVQHYCLHGDTPVTLASGVSMRIKHLRNLPEILTLGENGTFIPARPSNHLVQGRKECLKLLFSDGRTLVCTPDHEIRTTNGWCRADALVAGKSRVVLGLEGPLYDPAEDNPAHIAAFKLTLNGALHMKNAEGVARAHALARLLGSLYSDGLVSYIEEQNTFSGRLCLDHRIDADQAAKDVTLVVGKCGKLTEPNGTHNYYEVLLPSHFIRALHSHPKILIPYGKRTLLAYALPELVMDPACPKSFVREFLGSLFGGDGSAPCPYTCAWNSVKFSMNKDKTVLHSLEPFYHQIITLLKRFDITKVTIQSEQNTAKNHPKSVYYCNKTTLSRTLYLLSDEILPFQERVGFRYCAHKQQRLAVAAAFFRADSYTRKQAQELVKRVDEMTGYSKAKQEGKEMQLKVSILKAYNLVLNDMKTSELFLNEEQAIPKCDQVWEVLRGSRTFKNIMSKSGRIKPYDFIASVDATMIFSETLVTLPSAESTAPLPASASTKCSIPAPVAVTTSPNKHHRVEGDEFVTSPSRKVRYGVSRELDGFPTWTATFVGSKPTGMQDVYDISVPKTENFVAMGITVHNCLMSVAGSYTDFHIDFGGSSVWYHVVRGEKVFLLVPPTMANLAAFEHWCSSPRQSFVFFGDQVPQCYRLRILQGQTFFIPSGWIHAVFTPIDSLVFGGNFVHSLSIEMQLAVSALEARTFVPSKFRFPYFDRIHWYAAKKMAERFDAVARGILPGRPLLPAERRGYAALAQQLAVWAESKDEATAPPPSVQEPQRLAALLMQYTNANADVSIALNAPPLLPLPPPPLKLRLSVASNSRAEENVYSPSATAAASALAAVASLAAASSPVLISAASPAESVPVKSEVVKAEPEVEKAAVSTPEPARVVLKLKKPSRAVDEGVEIMTNPRKRQARKDEDDFEYGPTEAAEDADWDDGEAEPEEEEEEEEEEPYAPNGEGDGDADEPEPTHKAAKSRVAKPKSAAPKASPALAKKINKKSTTTARQRLQAKLGIHGSTARAFPAKR